MDKDSFNRDKFNTDLAESVENLEKACDKLFEINEESTLHEIALSLEYQQKKRNNKRLNDIESRLDKIEMILKENNIK